MSIELSDSAKKLQDLSRLITDAAISSKYYEHIQNTALYLNYIKVEESLIPPPLPSQIPTAIPRSYSQESNQASLMHGKSEFIYII